MSERRKGHKHLGAKQDKCKPTERSGIKPKWEQQRKVNLEQERNGSSADHGDKSNAKVRIKTNTPYSPIIIIDYQITQSPAPRLQHWEGTGTQGSGLERGWG